LTEKCKKKIFKKKLNPEKHCIKTLQELSVGGPQRDFSYCSNMTFNIAVSSDF
jgi:hypothetical protein